MVPFASQVKGFQPARQSPADKILVAAGRLASALRLQRRYPALNFGRLVADACADPNAGDASLLRERPQSSRRYRQRRGDLLGTPKQLRHGILCHGAMAQFSRSEVMRLFCGAMPNVGLLDGAVLVRTCPNQACQLEQKQARRSRPRPASLPGRWPLVGGPRGQRPRECRRALWRGCLNDGRARRVAGPAEVRRSRR